MDKSADAFKTISEAAEDLDLPQHVLRFWETRFPQIKPLKRAGGRRFYRPADVRLLAAIRKLLYDEGYTIKGVQRLLKEQGAKVLQEGFTAPPDASVETSELLDEAASSEPVAPPLAANSQDDPAGLRAVLAMITECEEILRAARKPAF
jgi:DNA-binding transcriptional MerR regulator